MPDALSTRWQPTSAWASIATPGRGGALGGEAGVRIELVKETPIISIAARPAERDDLARIVADRLGATLPPAGRLTQGQGCDLVWSGRDHWLAVGPAASTAPLRYELARVAAVTDQSSARALVRVSGPDARDALAKGFSIDLHPTIFAPGCAAATSVAHVGVQIWQREAGCYTIAVPRSFASSFWSWLTAASAAYGYEVVA